MNENYKFWKKIWDMKGNSDSHDLLYLDGYEHLSNKFNGKEISDNILKQIEASEDSSILEVACGAGFLAREMQSVKYTGVDYSRPIVQKHKNLINLIMYFVLDCFNIYQIKNMLIKQLQK